MTNDFVNAWMQWISNCIGFESYNRKDIKNLHATVHIVHVLFIEIIVWAYDEDTSHQYIKDTIQSLWGPMKRAHARRVNGGCRQNARKGGKICTYHTSTWPRPDSRACCPILMFYRNSSLIKSARDQFYPILAEKHLFLFFVC